MLRWVFQKGRYLHVHLQTKQGKTDFQSQFMARHMKSSGNSAQDEARSFLDIQGDVQPFQLYLHAWC